VSTALQTDPEVRRDTALNPNVRVVADGKFLRCVAADGTEVPTDDRFLVKGVTYGTFAPDAEGYQFPSPARVAEDFR